MGKKLSSDGDLSEIIRDLGGTDEDLNLVADADFSGSDFEDSNHKAPEKGLADDVAKMWQELNGGSKPISKDKQGDKKKVSDSNGRGIVAPSKSDERNPKKTESEKPHKVVQREASTGGIDSRSSSGKNSAKPKQSAPEIKPVKVQPPSKKTRQAWDQYLASLNHPKDHLLVPTEQAWWELCDPEQGEPETLSEAPHPDFVDALKARAQELLVAENQLYYKQRGSDREFTTSLEFLKSGTFSDQLGTLSIISTESPLHSVRFLENLADKCEIKNRESACKALEVTKDLLVSHVMPDRRLRYFKDQPIRINTPLASVVAWSFEDFMKRYFYRILRVMEMLLQDTVENIRTRTLSCIFAFFQEKPEQEANLLRLALNKLGDPAGKVASRVKRLLMDVLQRHPGMKSIVAAAMSELLDRVNDYRTRYYAVDTLSEFILSNRDPGLANQLIYIYLGLFERMLKESSNSADERPEKPVAQSKQKKGSRIRAKRGKKGGVQQHQLDSHEMESQQHARLVAKIFTGLNRAFPFSNLDSKLFTKYVDTLYQMSHSPNVGTFIEALSFIFQLSKASTDQAGHNRYYRALYDSLLDNRLSRSSKLSKYMHLLLRSLAELKQDPATSLALSKRSLQVACNTSEVGAVASLIHVATLAPHSSQLVQYENKNENSKEVVSPEAQDSENDRYDPKKRDPRFAKAEKSQAWEALLLQRHFHPTVALYANNLLAENGEKQTLDMPDIEQYTVNSFLSKWSYKKPKAKESTRGGSIFQPLAGFTDLTLGVRHQKRGEEVPASMQNWKIKKAGDIAPDELFLYEYFSQRPDKKPRKQAEESKQDDSDSDAESLAEDEINEAMSMSGPGDLGGADLDFADVEDEDSQEDGDLEAGLEGAFASSDEDGADVVSRDTEDDIAGFDSDKDLESEAGDDFANFEGEADPEEDAPSENDGKKRKRGWAKFPTFLSAEQFEEMYEKEGKHSKKRR